MARLRGEVAQMGEDRPETGEQLEVSSGDYTYDMAHEAAMEQREPHRKGSAQHAGSGVQEAPPPSAEGDYSYDLAHEVPPAER